MSGPIGIPRERRVTALLSYEADAAWEARRAVGTLAPYLEAKQVDDLRLLVSELVTNSVRHSGKRRGELIALEIVVADHTVRVEVNDAGDGFDAIQAARAAAELGRHGLSIVSALANRWGVEQDPGTTVWLELDRTLPQPG